ncbi:MAG: flavin reductase family protein [Acidimicrobiia bacterium]
MIHSDNPFSPQDDDRLRRFRGRLVSPVTIITAGDARAQTGLTVSSLFAIDGAPPRLYAAIGPNSDLFDVVQETGRFVVHICRQGHEGLAEVFAGLRPSPGGMFATADWEPSAWGPTLTAMPDRASCSLQTIAETGWSGILIGAIDETSHTDLLEPLAHFRGSYRKLAD